MIRKVVVPLNFRMSLVQLFILSTCCWTAAARYIWSDVPKLLLEYVEITEGEFLDVGCTVPIDYRGGECRLFRGDSDYPFVTVTAQSYSCNFHVGSNQLLGHRPVGSKISIRCDYKIQNFISKSSDSRNIIVWGTKPSPKLSVSRHFSPLDDSIEVTCSPPVTPVSRFNLSCTYDPVTTHYIRSQYSNHISVFVVDMSKVSSSMDCEVSGPQDQLENSSWTTTGTNGANVTVRVTNSSLPSGHICT
ncbi:hypothetical protein OJAV_G00034600 [Oryzias javanicus]|uniref:Uncharacterized protein n=1 Tax=Oryzias javanicus TaxID=123683 RepID=A0A437DG37_ORYJA|nr:hypothetical protein OJAV_G00034600 [Oryzias javanicus]